MTANRATVREEPSEQHVSIRRRDVLKVAGAATAGIAVATGPVSATGKGISWVAFCGCDTEPCIRFISQQDDDESVTELAYNDENCDAVYYKLGQEVRIDNTSGSDFIINTDEPDLVDVDGNDPAVNRDPCGELSGTSGVKIEIEDILDEDGNLKAEYAC